MPRGFARRGALAVLLALCLAAASCTQAPPERRDVAIGLIGEPASVFADDPSARAIAAAVTETLVRLDAQDELVARLASRVPTGANGGLTVEDAGGGSERLAATFELRPGLRWHDGRPITSADVVFAWREDLRAPVGSEVRYRAERVSAMDVVDERTVRVRYRAGERWDGYALAPRVLPQHILASATGEVRAAYEREPVHAGPFAIAAWLPGHGVTLSAFPGYALGPPALGRLEVRFFPDRDALLDALERDEIDVAPAPALEADLARLLDRLADGTRFVAYYTPIEAATVLRFGPAFAEDALRRAVELTIDRQRIVDIVFAGRARVATSYLAPPLWAAADLGPPPPLDRDLARALALGAGYRPGEQGILERDGRRLIVTLLVSEGSSARLQAARLVAGDLAAIGIAADVRAAPAAEVAEALRSGDFDLAIASEEGDDPQRATARYREAVDPWFDALAAVAEDARERNARRELYVELQRLWVESRTAVPLYQDLVVDLASARLAGVRPPAHGGPITWNAHEWRFGPS
ncbi:MAG: peptide ABC transporter substrate-binding protein [Candidatus Limnocylindria bacterium]